MLQTLHTVVYILLLPDVIHTTFSDTVHRAFDRILGPIGRSLHAAESSLMRVHALSPPACACARQYIIHKMHVLRVVQPKQGGCPRMHFNSHPHLLVNLFFSWAYAISLLIAFIMHFSSYAYQQNEIHMYGAVGSAAFFAWLRCINYLRITPQLGPFVITIGICVQAPTPAAADPAATASLVSTPPPLPPRTSSRSGCR